jgi:hypothetical protein
MSIGVALEAIALKSQRAHNRPMTKRATKRPKNFAKPAHWSNDPPPKPEAAGDNEDPDGLSPTRYGDWVKKGIAVDF